MSLSLKSIKVQIRQDLAMDVSATSCAMDRSLCPLPPQAETPTVPGQKPQSSSTQPQIEIKNRTLVFPPTASGESSGKYRTCQLNILFYLYSNKILIYLRHRLSIGFWNLGLLKQFFFCAECSLEVENHGEEVRWYLSSFAPPYVKVCDVGTYVRIPEIFLYWFWLHCYLWDQGVDSSGDVYRATYSAFRCEKVSGTLGIQERMQVGVWMCQTSSRLWQS